MHKPLTKRRARRIAYALAAQLMRKVLPNWAPEVHNYLDVTDHDADLILRCYGELVDRCERKSMGERVPWKDGKLP